MVETVITVRERQYSSAFWASLILHGVILLVLIVSVEFSRPMSVVENVDNNAKIMSAVAVNMPPLQAVEPTIPPPSPEPQPIKPVDVLPKVSPEDAVQAQKEKALEQAMQKQQAIAIAEQRKKLKEQNAALAKKLAAEKKMQAEKDKLAKQKALELAMEKELKEQTAKSLQQQLLSDQRRVAGAKARGEVNKYKALILQAIGRRWVVPSGIDKSLSSELLIRLAPGGTVLDVEVTKSSGSVALDHSARDAVFKASPLPVPVDSDAFEPFRQFVLKVKPENLIAHDMG